MIRIYLIESKILPGKFVSVKLQFDNPDTSRVLYEGEEPKKNFTYTYSEHGVVLATKNDPEADDVLKIDSEKFVKDAWSSLKRIQFEHGTQDFIPLEPEMRTMRYKTYRNGYVRLEYGYALLYAIGEDIKTTEKFMVGDIIIVGINQYEVLNKTSITDGEEINPGPYIPLGIIFELEQLTKEDN